MKYLILFGVSFFLVFNMNSSKAQSKIEKDTVYYLLDTAAVPIKDRIFKIEKESPYITSYALLCKCYPWEADPVFTSTTSDTKSISKDGFKAIKTISLSKLIEMVVRFGKDKIDKNIFYFIEPVEDKMKVSKVFLLYPRKPRVPSIDSVTIKPSKD